MADNKTQMGVSENIEALLSYSLWWITGIIFLVVEKENKFVRFHAMQSICTFLPIFIIAIAINILPIIGQVIFILLWVFSIVLWIVLMFEAYRGNKLKLPYVGDFAEKQIGI